MPKSLQSACWKQWHDRRRTSVLSCGSSKDTNISWWFAAAASRCCPDEDMWDAWKCTEKGEDKMLCGLEGDQTGSPARAGMAVVHYTFSHCQLRCCPTVCNSTYSTLIPHRTWFCASNCRYAHACSCLLMLNSVYLAHQFSFQRTTHPVLKPLLQCTHAEG